MKTVTFIDKKTHALTWTRNYETTEEYFEIMDNVDPETWELFLPDIRIRGGKEVITCNGQELKVRGGAWLDSMNSCFYTVIHELGHYLICHDIGSGEMFALPNY